MQTVVIVPPVAVINFVVGKSSVKPELVTNQPRVESIKVNITDVPSVSKTPSEELSPAILSEPFGATVTLFVSNVFK